MHPTELERLVDHELRTLPAPRAPRTLLPRVMHAVRSTAAAPAPRGWLTWPWLWQVTSAAALVLLMMGVVRVWPVAQETVVAAFTDSSPAMTRVAEVAQDLARRIDVMVSAGRVVWRVLLQPFAMFALVMVAAMVTACAVFGSALGRVAFGGASQ